MNVDPSGHFGVMAIIGISAIAMLLGGGAQLASNALTGAMGSKLWRGVAGAALGTGINALVLCLTVPIGVASIFLSAGSATVAQTGTDILETLIREESVDWKETAESLFLNFGTTVVGNFLGGTFVPTNAGWFQPRKFLSVFTRPYGQKNCCRLQLELDYLEGSILQEVLTGIKQKMSYRQHSHLKQRRKYGFF